MDKKPELDTTQNPPKVSVCTISFNHAHCIQDCIDGVSMQEYGGEIEHIIADDRSTDLTANIIEESIEKNSSIAYKLIFQDKNVGINRNLIDGLEACEGEFIALCEGDDYWINPDKVSSQVSRLIESPELAMATHECYRIYFPPEKFRSFQRAAKMFYWDTRTYGFDGAFALLTAIVQDREKFWAKDRCKLEAKRKRIYHLTDLLNGTWVQPFCSIVMRKRVVAPFIECLKCSEGGHQLALLLGGVFGGINHDLRPMAVKRDQKSSVTLDPIRKAKNRRKNMDIQTNNRIKRYRSLLRYADEYQSSRIEDRIEQYLKALNLEVKIDP